MPTASRWAWPRGGAPTGSPTVFNGYRLAGGHFVWGLTYRMLKDFFRTLDPNWVAPDRE